MRRAFGGAGGARLETTPPSITARRIPDSHPDTHLSFHPHKLLSTPNSCLTASRALAYCFVTTYVKMADLNLQEIHDFLVEVAKKAGEMITSAKPSTQTSGEKKNCKCDS